MFSLKKLYDWLKRNFWDILIILVLFTLVIYISFKNFTPGTYLIGWDNLLPELNFKLNIGRSLSAVWQEYQGLGLLGGMGHAADLPRQVFLWASSFVLPTSFLRYFWAFLMLAVGPLGVYALVSRVFVSREVNFLSSLAGFASAIFYLFNLATLQTFYTPFETFVSFYGFFPWLLYFALQYLHNEKKWDLIMFIVVSIMGTTAFYVQTLFVVYAIFLTVFAIETIVRYGKSGLFRCVKLGFITLFVNVFWLLPVIYFSLTNGSIPANSHINSIATPETQIMNLARADFKDIAILKGYWFDYYDWKQTLNDRGQNGTYDYLYKTWINYTTSSMVQNISLTLFFISIVGVIVAIFKKKRSFAVSLLALFGISYFMLNGGVVPGIPLFTEIFRNAFTKWANAMAFIYAVGIGCFVYIFANIIKNKFKYFLGILIAIFIAGMSIFAVKPILTGEFIAKSMKLSVPSYYLDTINYFKTQDHSLRIADFPLTDFFGWKLNDWGYRGSGFLWYGIPQPMLDRAFDVWSPYNEEFYNEIAHAVGLADANEFKYVLNKYQVSFILFDESIIEPGNTGPSIKIQKEKDFIESSGFINKEKEFGKIIVYKVNLDVSLNTYVAAPITDFGAPFIITGQVNGPVIQEAFGANQGYPQVKNCNLIEQGSVVKTKRDGGNYYAAYNGATSCDYFYYPTLDHSKAYKMRLTGKNISGRSLKFYLYNVKNESVDLQELLPTGDFDKSYVILPTASASGTIKTKEQTSQGFTLNVETRSFGRIASENLLTKVEFSPVDSNLREQSSKAVDSVSNNLKIFGVNKYGTWAYTVDVQGNGLMQLGQGYEDGWIAFRFLNPRFQVFEHKKLSGWANGWTIVPANESGNQTIYVIFWPQLLEWVGMVLGAATLFVVFRIRRHSKT